MRWLALATVSVCTLTMLRAQAVVSADTPAETASLQSRPAIEPGKRPPTPRLTDMQRAVEEFKLQTRNLGLRADSPASARKKSKTAGARWHGRIFENFRNDILDAVPHEIRQRGSNKSLLRRNQFGFNLAGPLVIPRVFDGSRGTFFSVSYEGVRERISRSYLRTVPTIPERSGDFGETVDLAGEPLPIFDPASTRANPAYDSSIPVSTDNLQYLRDPFPLKRIPASRLDPIATSALQHYPAPNATAGPFFRNNYFAVSPETNAANGMIVKVDHNLNQKNRLETQVAFSNGLAGAAKVFPNIADTNPSDRTFTSRRASVQHSYTASPQTVFTVDLHATSDSSRNQGEVFPSYQFGGLYSPLGRANPNAKTVYNTYWVTTGASTRQSKHSVRTGVTVLHQQHNTFAAQYPAGSFQFMPGLTSLPGINNTGYSFASYLLGLSDSAETSVVTSPSYFRRNQTSAYLRDTWEISKTLTVSGSLNLEITTPRIEKYDRQSTIDLAAINPENNQPGALVIAGRDGYGRGFQPLRVRPEPSASLAWSLFGKSKTIARASYSRSYSAAGLAGGQFGTQGFNAYPTFLSENTQLYPALRLRDGLPPTGQQLPDLRPDAVNNMIADLIDMSSRQPCVQAVGLSLEREIGAAAVVTTGFYHYDGKNMYVGSSAANLNAIHPDALQYRDLLNDDSFRRDLRPFPQYRGFDLNGQYPLGKYQRDSGYLRLEKRTSGGLGFSAYYEFSKQMDDYSGPYGTQDFYNRENEWSLTAGSNPHRLSLSYVYELPLGSSKGLLAFSDWRRHMVEGWSVSGMTSVSSGDPLALHPQFNNTGGVVSALNVNVVPGIDPAVPDQGPLLWFNPAAFVQPADFTIGNASRTHPSLLGPGSQNHDLSLTKRFSLDAERSVEFSAVGFNFINRANWTDPDTIIGPEDAPNANAGKIIGSRGGRVVQLGLRYSF